MGANHYDACIAVQNIKESVIVMKIISEFVAETGQRRYFVHNYLPEAVVVNVEHPDGLQAIFFMYFPPVKPT
jgi:hypothetical protein